MKEKLNKLRQNESLIDEYINGMDFKTSLVDIRNNINLALSVKNINQIYKINDEDVDGRIDVFTSIYTFLKGKMNNDIDSALRWDGLDLDYNNNMYSELKVLSKYKMLFNILPLVYRVNKNIYDVNIEDNVIYITYLNENLFKFECYDILFTRINLIANFNENFNSINQLMVMVELFFHKDGFHISYDDQIKIYKKFINEYIELYQSYFYMLSDDLLEKTANFNLIDFKRFFAGIYTLNQISIEIAGCFLIKDPKSRNDDHLHEFLISDVFNRKESYETFRDFFCQLTELDYTSFENIIKYFMIDYDQEVVVDLSSEEYIQPFVKKNGYIYFNTIFNTIVINPRNLIFSLKEFSIQNKNNIFDNHSSALSINFTNILSKIFRSYGFQCLKEQKWDNGSENSDIDLIVCCHHSKNILLIECKAIIAATNYKSFFKMQDRVEDGIDQLKKFEGLSDDFKIKFLSNKLGCDVENYTLNSCLASDGGFGNGLVWDSIFENEFVPMNISMIILYLDKFKNLSNIKENFYQLISELNSKIESKLIKCEINFSEECGANVMIHDSTDAHYMNLIEEKRVIHSKLKFLYNL